ncbi:uncharacterized protein LOC114539026 [Dendronephthya gigantea]|uniref:uncharacterized protein LOC114539026 n=1 Tax=Dendronephthya gigantea TaxID=151771 RepID=UPI00106A9107|nr:uncharacterized protein LOC114539026 [Dendronephthya gigantea]
MYVDDLVSGGETVAKAKQLKEISTEIFEDGTFQLHKWHSNVPELEQTPTTSSVEDTFAKQQLGATSSPSTILGLSWDKDQDVIQVEIPAEKAQPTKRGILGKIAKIYDPLRIIAPVTLQGKLLYRDCCDRKVAWDARLPSDLEGRWLKWETSLPNHVNAPRSLAQFQEKIEDVKLHAFGDASGYGVAASVFAVVKQQSGISQGLVAAKSRLAKKNLTIPRLELVSAHMATNLVHNIREALDGFPVSQVFGWLDSTVALHWIRGGGEFKQFVGNRVRKIQEKSYIQWRHVSSEENPADLGSRGGKVSEKEHLWWKGPKWLPIQDTWPSDIVTNPNPETIAEIKPLKSLFKIAVQEPDEFDQLLKKWNLWRTLRICSWISRFICNIGRDKESVSGPLSTEEIEARKLWWIARGQERNKNTAEFVKDRATKPPTMQ